MDVRCMQNLILIKKFFIYNFILICIFNIYKNVTCELRLFISGRDEGNFNILIYCLKYHKLYVMYIKIILECLQEKKI